MNFKKIYEDIFDNWNSGNYSVAFELLEKYLIYRPNSLSVNIIKADILIKFSRFDEAETILKKLLQTDFNEHIDLIYLQFGHLYKNKGEFVKSNKWYTKALLTSKDSANIQIYLACNYLSLGVFQKAQKHLEQVIKSGENLMDEAYYNLGVIEKYSRNYEKAIKYFNMALEIDPEYELAIREKKDVVLAMDFRTN